FNQSDLWVWDIGAGKVVHRPRIDFGWNPEVLAVSPGARHCLAMGFRGPQDRGGKFTVDVFNAGPDRSLQFKTDLARAGERGSRTWAFSPDGETVAFGNNLAIDLYDLKTGKIKDLPGAMAPVGPPSTVAFSPDRKLAGSLCYGSKPLLWDAADGKFLKAV